MFPVKLGPVSEDCPDAVVISGDAVVSKVTGFMKSQVTGEAAQFLRELSGSEFQFVTSLAIIHSQTRRMLSTVEISDISFRPLA